MIEFGYLADESGKGIRALYKASAPGFPDNCALLIKASVPVDTRRGHWGGALQAASARGHAKIVQLLLNNNANVNLDSGKYGSALQAASYKVFEDIV